MVDFTIEPFDVANRSRAKWVSRPRRYIGMIKARLAISAHSAKNVPWRPLLARFRRQAQWPHGHQ
jgi:hypothetical protein